MEEGKGESSLLVSFQAAELHFDFQIHPTFLP